MGKKRPRANYLSDFRLNVLKKRVMRGLNRVRMVKRHRGEVF